MMDDETGMDDDVDDTVDDYFGMSPDWYVRNIVVSLYENVLNCLFAQGRRIVMSS